MIEIHKPELEALIHQRMASGKFATVEDLLSKMFETLPEAQQPLPNEPPKQSLHDFLKQSPLWGSGIVVERMKDGPRKIDFE